MGYQAKTIKRSNLATKQATATAGAEAVDQDFWDPAAGKRVYLTGLHFYATAATLITIYSKVDSTKTTIFKTYVAADGTLTLDFGSDVPFTTDHILGITIPAGSGTVEINAWGHEE